MLLKNFWRIAEFQEVEKLRSHTVLCNTAELASASTEAKHTWKIQNQDLNHWGIERDKKDL